MAANTDYLTIAQLRQLRIKPAPDQETSRYWLGHAWICNYARTQPSPCLRWNFGAVNSKPMPL
jgi:hypothetical protein